MLLWAHGWHSKAVLHTSRPGYREREKRPNVMLSVTPAARRLRQGNNEFQEAWGQSKTHLRKGVRKRKR